MSEVSARQQEWEAFFAEKERAESEMEEGFRQRQERLRKAQKALSRERDEARRRFAEEWSERRSLIQQERQEAIIERLMAGDSQASLLKEMGSSNTVLLSRLAAEARRRQRFER